MRIWAGVIINKCQIIQNKFVLVQNKFVLVQTNKCLSLHGHNELLQGFLKEQEVRLSLKQIIMSYLQDKMCNHWSTQGCSHQIGEYLISISRPSISLRENIADNMTKGIHLFKGIRGFCNKPFIFRGKTVSFSIQYKTITVD